jgi:quinol monooxygenase YgiN
MTANLITELVIQPDKMKEVLEYLRAMRDDVRKNEAYTVFYEMYQLPERPNEVWVVEVFENEAGKSAHLARHAYRTPKFDTFLAKPAKLNVANAI